MEKEENIVVAKFIPQHNHTLYRLEIGVKFMKKLHIETPMNSLKSNISRALYLSFRIKIHPQP